jgi:hypothetical protein
MLSMHIGVEDIKVFQQSKWYKLAGLGVRTLSLHSPAPQHYVDTHAAVWIQVYKQITRLHR